MANNRLYLVDTSDGEFVCIAKGWGCAWSFGNDDLLDKFLKTRFDDGDGKTNLIIGTEGDDEFYEKWIIMDNAFKDDSHDGWRYYEST